MILKLMRLDAAAEDLGKHVLIGVGMASLLGLVTTGEREVPTLFSRHTTGGLRFLESIFLWILPVATLIGSKFWVRAPRFLLGLPLDGRSLVRSRLWAQSLHGLVVLAAAYGMASLDWRGGGVPVFTPGTWDSFPLFCAMSVMMLVLPTAIEPKLRELEMTAPMIVLTGLIWLIAFAVAAVLPWHPAVGWTALALALAAMTAVERRAASGLLTATGELDEAPAAGSPVAATAATPTPDISFQATRPAHPSRLLLTKTLLRIMHAHWLGWLFPVVLWVYGLSLVKNYREGEDSLFYGTYVIFFFLGAIIQSLKRLRTVDAWPVSRRALFRLAVLPSVLGYVLGLGCGLLIPDYEGPVFNRPGVVDVPHEYKGLARDGEVPATVAPWGESYAPEGYRVLPGLDWRVYRPFEYGPENSPRFLAWVTDQALAAVHDPATDGAPHLAPAEADSSLADRMREERFMVPLSRELATEGYSRALAAEVLLMIGVGLGLCLLSLLGMHARWDSRRRKLGALGVAVPITVAALLTLAQLTGWTRMWVPPAAVMILIRRGADAVGGAPWLWWTAAAVVAVAAGLVLQERFVRVEAVGQDCRAKRGLSI